MKVVGLYEGPSLRENLVTYEHAFLQKLFSSGFWREPEAAHVQKCRNPVHNGCVTATAAGGDVFSCNRVHHLQFRVSSSCSSSLHSGVHLSAVNTWKKREEWIACRLGTSPLTSIPGVPRFSQQFNYPSKGNLCLATVIKWKKFRGSGRDKSFERKSLELCISSAKLSRIISRVGDLAFTNISC